MNANSLTVSLLSFALAMPHAAAAQGYAGLGTDAEGFAIPERGVALQFPTDHGPHPDYRIEWWYLTANLQGDDGQDYGIQWTLFRSALRTTNHETATLEGVWEDPQIWLGHAGLTTPSQHFHAERIARGGIGQAGVTAEPFAAYIDDWNMVAEPRKPDQRDALDSLRLSARGADFSYQLNLQADGPLVLQGEQGYSVKSATGQASYYYSQPHYQVSGTLNLPDGPVTVQGDGWLDREWSSQPLAPDQSGWDWFSLRFDSGAKMMGFQLRGREVYTSGTWIEPDGSAVPLAPGALQAEPLRHTDIEGRTIPTGWRLTLAERNLDIEVDAINPDAWMGTSFPYWEGPVRISGNQTGIGYLEMTGYTPDGD